MVDLQYAKMPMSKTWGRTGEVAWADDGSGTPWLAEIWRCHETGEVEYKPLRMVKVPARSEPLPLQRVE